MATQTLLTGLDTSTLESRLASAQEAYLQLATGAKVVKQSYAQGSSTMSVEYTPADMGSLATLIQTLQQQLGLVAAPRAPIRPIFRP